MRSANDVAFELVAQDLSVTSLNTARHRLPNKWKRLVPIETAQLDDFAVQLEAVIGKLGLSKTETPGIFIEQLSGVA